MPKKTNVDDIKTNAAKLAARLRGELDQVEAELDAFDVKPGPKPPELQELMKRVHDVRSEYRQAATLAGERVGVIKVGPPPTP